MNLATHFDGSKLWDFTFLRWLAPDLLDGFSIGRYEEKHESFDLFAAKFEREQCDFPGENRSGAGALQNNDSSLVLLLFNRNTETGDSESFKIAQKTAFEAKGRLYSTGKVIQRIFNVDLQIYLAIYRYR